MSRLGRGHPIKAQYQRGVIGVHVADSATVGVLFTPSGVELLAEEYTDSATATLNVTLGELSSTFPAVSIIDDFNRGSIGANWPETQYTSVGVLSLSGNAIANPTGDFRSGYYNVQEFDATQQAFITIVDWNAVNNAKGVHILLRLQDPSTTFSGYICHFISDNVSGTTDYWSLETYVGGTSAGYPGFGAPTNYQDGDKVGVTAEGDTFTFYRYRAGVWNVLGSVTDDTYLESGYVGLLSSGQDDIYDDFGAGTPVSVIDTFHGVDALAASLALTPSGVDVYETSGVEYTDSATVTLNLDVRDVSEYPFPTNRTEIDNFNRSDRVLNDTASGGLEWANVNIGGGGELLEIISNQLAVGFGDDTRSSYIVEQFDPDVEFYVDVVTAPISPSAITMFARAQQVGIAAATWDGYALKYSALGSSWTLYVVINGVFTSLNTGSTVVSAGSKIGFRVKGTTLTGYHWHDGVWTQICGASGITDYPNGGHFGIEADQNVVRLENLSGGVILPVEIREYNDAATVTLTLAPLTYAPGGGVFPTTSQLDDFERADEIFSTVSSPWRSGIYAGEQLQIVDGELVNLSSWGSAYWNTTTFDADQEVWYEFADDPFGTLGGTQGSAGIEPAVRISAENTSIPNCYFFHFQGDTVHLWRMQNGAQDALGSTGVWSTVSAGDKIGVEAVGPLLRAWEKVGSNPWEMILEVDVSIEDDSPDLGGGYIGMLLNGAFFENMGGGNIAAAQLPVDTYHGVDASTARLSFTPSGVDEYTPVAGVEYTDSATVPLAFSVPALAFPTVGVIDDFNRGSIGANWPAFPFGANSMVLTGNQLVSASADFRGNYFAPAQFGADQEAFVTLVDFPTAFAFKGVHLYLRVQTPDISATDGYKLHFLYVNGSVSHWGMERITDGASGGFVAYGDDVTPIYADGDIVGARIVGNTITMYRFRNGVWQVLGSATDSPYVDAGYVALSHDDAGTIDNFGAGTHVVAPDTFHGVDSATATLTFTVTGTDIEGVVDAQTVTVTLTASAVEVREHADTATVALALTPSTIETQEAVDATTVTIRVTGTSLEVKEAQDAATAVLGLSPSAVVLSAAVDSAVASVLLSVSALEQHDVGGIFTDAATARLSLTASATELATRVDSATANVALTASAVESYGRTDLATASLLFAPSAVETYETAASYTDAATATLLFSVSSVEGIERQDAATATLNLTVTYTSAYSYTDSATAPLTFTPSALDERTATDAETAVLLFTVTSTEEIAIEDSGTLYLDLTPKTSLTFDNPLLVGVLSNTWAGAVQARSYSATFSSPGLVATVTGPRFAATISIDTVGDLEPHYAGTMRR